MAMGFVILKPLLTPYVRNDVSVDAMVGLVSYGFPYSAIKAWSMRVLVKCLQEASSIADKAVISDSQKGEDADAARL